jgi:hypothetical protein
MPPTAKREPKEAQPSRRMKLKKSNCRSTGDRARAQESMGMAVGQVPLLREEDALERVPRFAGWPPAKWLPPTGGGRCRGAGRGDPAEDPVNPQRRRPALGLRIPRPREGHGRGSGWCHPREDDPLQAPHPLQDEDPGAGSDRSEGVEDSEAPAGDSLCAGHRSRIQGGRRAHCS